MSRVYHQGLQDGKDYYMSHYYKYHCHDCDKQNVTCGCYNFCSGCDSCDVCNSDDDEEDDSCVGVN